jgi:hypothetical protein
VGYILRGLKPYTQLNLEASMVRSVIVLALFLTAGITHAQETLAPKHNYQCIADSLQAYNSDVLYNLSSEEIDEILADEASVFHDLTVAAALRCDAE